MHHFIMKSFYLIYSVFFLSASFVIGDTNIFKCPISKKDEYYSNTDDCSSYFKCESQALYGALLNCPSGLWFNPYSQLCELADTNKDCSTLYGYPKSKAKHVTRNPALRGHSIIGPDPTFDCPDFGVFPHPILCNYYYECWGSVAQLGICTENQLFDLTYNGCNYPHLVDCGDRFHPSGTPPGTQPPTSPQTTSGPPGGSFTCPTRFGAFPHEGACEYYWQCYDWEETLELCQNDQLFDIRYSGCNFDYLTACQDRPRPPGANATITPPNWTTTPLTTTRPTTTTTTTRPTTTTTVRSTTTTRQPPGFVCPSPDGSFADPLSCFSYYVCVAGNVIGHQTCPEGLAWNDVIKACDFPWNVVCSIM